MYDIFSTLKIFYSGQARWLTPKIPATKEAEIVNLVIQGQFR
jgi:hypothetical protein